MSGGELVNQETGEIVQFERVQPLTVEEIIAQRQVITKVLQHVMQDGVHYGKIPGTGDRKALLKPGADLLLSTFHIATDPEVEDLSTSLEIRYRVRLRGTMMHSGHLVGVGIGEASSNEEKYRWKRCSRREYNETPENMRRIKYYNDNDVMQVRCNPYDYVNTILKMAKKRASVDLVLTALAAAEIFDRVDDVIREQEARERQASVNGSSSRPVSPGEPPVSDPRAAAANAYRPADDDEPAGDQDRGRALNELRQLVDKQGMREVDVFAQFGVTGWGGIPDDKIDEVRTWIQEAV